MPRATRVLNDHRHAPTRRPKPTSPPSFARLDGIGCEAHVSRGQLRTVIGAIGDREQIQTLPWEAMAGVERAVPVLKSFRFVSRDFQPEDSVIQVG